MGKAVESVLDVRRGFLALLLVLALVTGVGAASIAPEEVAGDWHGAIDIAGTPLEIVVRFRVTDGALSGTIDIPAQGAFEVPLADIEHSRETIRFLMAGIPGDPVFKGVLSAERIDGDFTQAGMTFPFGVEKQEADQTFESAAGPSNDRYVDPLDRYSVPIPTGWIVDDRGDLVILSDPEGGIRLAIAPIEAEAEAAVEEAWGRFDPEFDLEPYQVLDVPPGEEYERSVVVNYAGGERVYQAAVVVHDGVSYVLLIDADLAALQRRAAQLQIVATGLVVTGVEQLDLTDVTPGPVAEIEAELDAFIESSMEAFGVPGASVAIVQDGEVVYLKGFGVKEAGGDDPITPDTHMMIGSIGKTMTTMLMAALVDEGLLDWQTRVVDVVPQFAVADPQLTETLEVRHLVCACTGVPRRDLELAFQYESLTAEDIIASLGAFEFFTGFGEAFQYSNQLVATGGYVAAAADGAPYGDLFDGYASSLAARVLEPIGMSLTTLSIDEVVARGEYATPHTMDLETGEYVPADVDVERLLTPVAPAGSHWSTARDMAQYLLTQLNRGVAPSGARVVSTDNLDTTWTPQVPMSATDSYGLGWMTGEYKGVRVVYHGGNTMGFTSELAFMPEAGLGIIVLANAQQSNVFNLAVRSRLFELVYDVESQVEKGLEFLLEQNESALAELRTLMEGEVDPEAVAPFLGRYTNDALGEILLVLDDERLVMDVGEFLVELRPVVDRDGEPDGYIALSAQIAGLPVELVEDENGELTVKIGVGAISYTFERVE